MCCKDFVNRERHDENGYVI